MFQAFIITLREGIEAALVIGLLLGYIRKIGRRDLARPVYGGVLAATLMSVAGAVAFDSLAINEEAYEGAVYLVSALFVGSMMLWMGRTSKHIRGDVQERVDAIAAGPSGGAAAFGLFLFTFLMIFREGVETVLFLGAATLTTKGLLAVLGALGGIGVAVLFCVAFVRGTVKVDLGRFFRVSGIVLGIFLAQLLVNGYHEFAEAGILPATRQEMSLVGPVVRNNVLFIIAVLLVPALAALSRPSRPALEPALDSLAGPERRLAIAKRRRERTWRASMIALSAVGIALLGLDHALAGGGLERSPASIVAPDGDSVRVPASSVADGRLHRFGVRFGDAVVRFLVRKGSTGDPTAALDACSICGDSGYVESEGRLVCLNCSADINPVSFGESGGCNPIPLSSSVVDGAVVVKLAELEKHVSEFHETAVAEVDPVCGMTVEPGREAERIERDGRTYTFCSPRCAETFRKEHR